MVPLIALALLTVAVQTATTDPLAVYPHDRAISPVDNSRTRILEGNVPPQLRTSGDLGPASPNLPISRMILTLKRDSEQQTAFDLPGSCRRYRRF